LPPREIFNYQKTVPQEIPKPSLVKAQNDSYEIEQPKKKTSPTKNKIEIRAPVKQDANDLRQINTIIK
jgi:hypothetical protein